MKGEKGMNDLLLCYIKALIVTEFTGTLLGFDDYVSK
jgi:hypothetical protein